MIAVGFDNGTLILLRGDLRRDRGAKQKTLLTGGSSGFSGAIGKAILQINITPVKSHVQLGPSVPSRFEFYAMI